MDSDAPATPIFHRFPYLPPEIRLQVWSLALPGPRTLAVSCQRGFRPTQRRYARSFSARAGVSALLQVNHEARAKALCVYGAQFRTEYATCFIYVAFNRGVLRLTEDVLHYVGQEERALVESMIVEMADTGYFGYFWTLQRMPRLRNLVLVLTDLPMDPRRGSTRRYLDVLREEFRDAIKSNPEWTCPHVKLLARDRKEVMGVITGRRGNDR